LQSGRGLGEADEDVTNVHKCVVIYMEADRLNYPARKRFSLSTPMNVSTTNDIIGGNSGSPLIDKDANVVGLIFEGNIFSLGGDYGYDGAQNRAIAVDSRALLEGLQKVYHFSRVVDEIEAGRR